VQVVGLVHRGCCCCADVRPQYAAATALIRVIKLERVASHISCHSHSQASPHPKNTTVELSAAAWFTLKPSKAVNSGM
jgi:hypothetical protein